LIGNKAKQSKVKQTESNLSMTLMIQESRSLSAIEQRKKVSFKGIPPALRRISSVSTDSSAPEETFSPRSSLALTAVDDNPNSTQTMAESAETSSKSWAEFEHVLPWASAVVWPLMLSVPLALSTPSSPWHYTRLFKSEWYEFDPNDRTQSPKPLGLSLGIISVAVGQVFVWIVFYVFKYCGPQEPKSVQSRGARPYEFWEGLRTHVGQPEGFVLLFIYLTVTWMFKLMPNSYYSFDGCIQWRETFLCLVVQDGIQFVMHYLEHVVSPAFYQMSHKPHHRFTNPRLFDAFNGSLFDTICMITIPLILTANIVRTANAWTYMAFGASYACWLTLIHSEYAFPWDGIFRALGFGTPADHHVHHKVFKYNYGHLFMWFDQMAGTYRDPKVFAPKIFNKNV